MDDSQQTHTQRTRTHICAPYAVIGEAKKNTLNFIAAFVLLDVYLIYNLFASCVYLPIFVRLVAIPFNAIFSIECAQVYLLIFAVQCASISLRRIH